MAKALGASSAETIQAVAECAAAVDQNYGLIEAKAEQARAQGMMVARIACKKGCAFCCHGRVVASVQEILRIADHLRRTLAPEEIDALVGNAKAYLARLASLAAYERSVLTQPCIFLGEDESCSIHPVRPIACRRHHSLDVGACKRAFQDLGSVGVPQILEIGRMSQPLIEGMDLGARAANLHPRRVDLVRGIVLALTTDAEARWFAGEDSFAEAEDAELLRLAGQV